MKKILLFALICSSACYGQETWRYTHTAKHPSGNFVDANDNIYGIGNKDYGVSSTSLGDVFLFKLSADGDSLWTASINGMADYQDDGGQIVVDNAGNVYVTGTLINDPDNHWKKDVMVAKFNSSGVQQWQFDYNGSEDHVDEPAGILLASDNQIIVGATTREDNFEDITLIKLDADGAQTWITHYDNNNSADFLIDMTLDANNDIVLFGSCDVSGNSEYSPTLIKYDLSGALLDDHAFTTDFPQSTFEEYEFSASDMDNEGNVYFYSQRRHTLSSFITNRRVTKANLENGIIAMDALSVPAEMEGAWDFENKVVVQADNNGDMLVGATLSIPFSSGANFVGRFTSAGVWDFVDTLTVTGSFFGAAYQLFNIGVFNNNDFIVTIDRTYNDGVNYLYNMKAVKFLEDGTAAKECVIADFRDISGGSHKNQSNLAFDSSDHPVLSISTGNHAMTTLKMDTTLCAVYGSGSTNAITETNFKNQISIFPNPADGNTRVTSNSSIEQIEVIDLNGRLIKSISTFGNAFIDLNLQEFNNGIYFIKVYSKGSFSTKKLIVSH